MIYIAAIIICNLNWCLSCIVGNIRVNHWCIQQQFNIFECIANNHFTYNTSHTLYSYMGEGNIEKHHERLTLSEQLMTSPMQGTQSVGGTT